MKCPNCAGKITAKNYDPEYEWYECPKCEGCFTADEITAAERPRKKSRELAVSSRVAPMAKGKKRLTEIADDAEAIKVHEQEQLKPRKSADKETKQHRDEVSTGQVVNVIGDEIEAICEEMGIQINRMNAREYYAMNLWRPLLMHGVHAREKKIPHALCEEHS